MSVCEGSLKKVVCSSVASNFSKVNYAVAQNDKVALKLGGPVTDVGCAPT